MQQLVHQWLYGVTEVAKAMTLGLPRHRLYNLEVLVYCHWFPLREQAHLMCIHFAQPGVARLASSQYGRCLLPHKVGAIPSM